MNTQILAQAVELSRRVGHVFIATSNDIGLPHVTASGPLVQEELSRVRIAPWFCPGTMANLTENKHVSIVVWGGKEEEGYQLLGIAEDISSMEVMDGIAPAEEAAAPSAQVERLITVNVKKILEFCYPLHSDAE